jgi:membrane-bound ClpP family serine protease
LVFRPLAKPWPLSRTNRYNLYGHFEPFIVRLLWGRRVSMDVIPNIAWAILLLLAGCTLVVLEVFIPSGGIISILAAVALIASIVIAFQESATTGPMTGFVFTAMTVFAVPALIGLAFKYWPRTPMGKAFLGELPTDEEVVPDDARRALLGRIGVARTKMLPSGAVEIDGQMIDAVSQGRAIEPGTYVVVAEVRANRVVVRPAGQDQRPSHQNPNDLLSRSIDELGIESLEDPLA